MYYIIGGAAGGGLLLIILIVVITVCLCRNRNRTEEKLRRQLDTLRAEQAKVNKGYEDELKEQNGKGYTGNVQSSGHGQVPNDKAQIDHGYLQPSGYGREPPVLYNRGNEIDEEYNTEYVTINDNDVGYIPGHTYEPLQ